MLDNAIKSMSKIKNLDRIPKSIKKRNSRLCEKLYKSIVSWDGLVEVTRAYLQGKIYGIPHNMQPVWDETIQNFEHLSKLLDMGFLPSLSQPGHINAVGTGRNVVDEMQVRNQHTYKHGHGFIEGWLRNDCLQIDRSLLETIGLITIIDDNKLVIFDRLILDATCKCHETGDPHVSFISEIYGSDDINVSILDLVYFGVEGELFNMKEIAYKFTSYCTYTQITYLSDLLGGTPRPVAGLNKEMADYIKDNFTFVLFADPKFGDNGIFQKVVKLLEMSKI
jgi:hypothetical protein